MTCLKGRQDSLRPICEVDYPSKNAKLLTPFSRFCGVLLGLILPLGAVFGQTTITSGSTVNASTIAANTAITINAGGTLNMDVVKTFSSITTANSGTSTISGSSALALTGNITVANGNTLSIAPSTSAVSLVTTGTSGYTGTVSGTGTLTLSNVITYGDPGNGNSTSLTLTITRLVTTGISASFSGGSNNRSVSLNVNSSTLAFSALSFTATKANLTIAYSSGTLEYASGSVTTTAMEWPTTNGPTNVTINSSGTITMLSTSARTVSGNLNLTAGTLADNGNTLTVQGNITGTATHTGTGKILMTGSGKTISGVSVTNLELNNAGGFSLNGSLIVNGALTFTSGKLGIGANSLNLAGTVGSSSLTNSITGSSSSVISISGTGTLGTIFFDQTSASTRTLSSLTINRTSSGLVTLGSSSPLIVSGDITLTAGTLADNGNTISVGGNIAGTATHSGAGKISMTGSGKTISGVTLGNLELNGSNFSLTGSPSITGNVTLTAGLLTLGSFNLNLSSASAFLGTPTATNMIVAEGSGALKKTLTTNGSFTFPVGDNTGTVEYSPITLTVAGTAYSSASIAVSLANNKHPNNSSTPDYLNRYWNVLQSGITSCTATVSATYLAADINGTEGSMKAGQLNGTFNQSSNPWVKYSVLGSNTLTATSASLASGQTSAFTGIESADPTVSISGGGVTICTGGSVGLTATPTGLASFIYSWSPTTGLSSSTVANPTASPSSTTTYTVTARDANGIAATANTTITISVNTAGSPSSTPTVCINTSLTAITITTTVATGISNDGVSGANGLPAGVSATWASNTITISGTPTESGTFNYSIPLIGGCGTVNATGTITVTANNTVGSPSSSPTLCVNTALTSITISTTGATGISNDGVPGANGLPTGVSAHWASNTITITGTPTSGGTFNYSIPLTGGCGSVNATGTISVNNDVTGLSAFATASSCSDILVTLQSSKLLSGVYTVTYQLNGSGSTKTATVVFTSGSPGSGSFYTTSTSGSTFVSIKSIAVSTCTSSTLTINTGTVTPGSSTLPDVSTIAVTASGSDIGNSSGSTVTITASQAKLSAGTYTVGYTVTDAAGSTIYITGSKSVTMAVSTRKNKLAGSFTTGQLSTAGNYQVIITSITASSGCTSSVSGVSASFAVIGSWAAVATGAWDTPATWGNSTGTGPSYLDGAIIINSGVTVTYDAAAISDTLKLDQFIIYGTLIINSDQYFELKNGSGTDMIIQSGGKLQIGTITNTGTTNGTLIFDDGVTHTGSSSTAVTFNTQSLYKHLSTTTEGTPPLATWNSTSTIQILGYTSSALTFSSTNWSQAFGEVIWNCSSQTADINLNGLLGGANTIQGGVTISSTGTAILRFGNSTDYTLTISGNLTVSGSSRFSMGPNNGNGPAITLSMNNFVYGSTAATPSSWLCEAGVASISISGSITINSGTVFLSDGGASILKSGSTINLAGDLTVATGATLSASSANSGRTGLLIYNNLPGSGAAKTHLHTINGTGTIGGYMLYQITANQTVKAINESAFISTATASGSFSVASTATLVVQSTDVSGAIQSGTTAGNIRIATAARTFSSGATIEYGGSSSQVISGTGHPATPGVDCKINNSNGVTVSSTGGTVTIGGNLKVVSGNLTVQENNVTVTGNVETSGGNVIVNTGVTNQGTTTFRTDGSINMTGGNIQMNSSASENARNTALEINGDLLGTNYFTFTGANCQVTIGGTSPTTPSRDFPINSATTLEQLTMNRTGATLVVPKSLTVGNYTSSSGTYSGGIILTNGNVRMNASLVVTTFATLTSGILYFEGQTVELQRNINTSYPNGVFSANSSSTLNITTDFGGVANTLAFSPSGNILGTLLMNRTDTGTPLITLNSALTISGTLYLTDGEFYNQSGLNMSSGTTIVRTGQSTFASGSGAPTGGPYNVIYNNYTNGVTGTSSTVTSLSTGAELQGSLNNVTSNATGTVTLSQSITGIGTLAINSGAWTSGANAISMAALVNSGIFNAPNSTLTLTGNLTHNTGATFTHNSGTVIFNGTSSIIYGSTTPLFNNVTINGTLNGPALLKLAGNFINNGTFSAGTGTVKFAGTTQAISGSNSPAFYDVQVDNTSSVTLGVGISSSDLLTNNGSFNSGAYGVSLKTLTNSGTYVASSSNTNISGTFTNNTGATFTHNSGTVTFNGTSSIIYGANPLFNHVTITGTLNGPSLLKLVGDFTDNGTFSAGTGAVEFAGITQAISGSNSPAFYDLQVDNTSSVTLGVGISSSDLLTNNGSFNSGAYGVSLKTLTNSGTYVASSSNTNISGTFTNNTGATFAHNSGKVTFNGTSSIIYGANPLFNHVIITGTLNGPSLLKLVGDFTDNGTFSAGSGAVEFAGITQAISGSNSPAFYDVQVDNTSSVTLGVGLSSTDLLTNNGSFNSGVYGVSLNTLTNSGIYVASSTSTSISGNFTNNTGATFTHNSGTVTFNGTSSILYGANPLFNHLTVSGTLISPSLLKLVGDFTNNGTFSAGTGTVEFTGTTQSISGSNSPAFYDLQVDNTSIVTLGVGISSTNSFTNNGTFNSGVYAVSLKTLYNTSIGTFNASSTSTTLTDNFTNDGAFNHNSGTVVFDGASSILGLTNPDFYKLTINTSKTLTSSSGTIGISNDFINNGSFVHNNGTVKFNGASKILGGSTIDFYNVIIGSANSLQATSGTMNVARDFTNDGTFNSNLGTVYFNGTSKILGGSPIDFNHVTIGNGNSLLATSGIMNVAGDFTNINGSFSHNNGTVLFNGSSRILGSSSIDFYNITIGSNHSLLAAADTMRVAKDFINNGTFTHNSGTVKFNGSSTISGNVVFNHVSISGSLTAPSILHLQGDFTNSGSFASGSNTVSFEGTALQNMKGDSVTNFNNISLTTNAHVSVESTHNLKGVLSLAASATFDADGWPDTGAGSGVFTLLSTGDKPAVDASIATLPSEDSSVPSNNQVKGNVTVQRYMGRAGSSLYDYHVRRDISSPVQNASVADLQNFIPVTGPFSGSSIVPNSPSGYPVNYSVSSLQRYKESEITDSNHDGLFNFNDGWENFPTSTNTEVFERGRGYSLFIFGVASENSIHNDLWALRGPINSGTITLPVTLTKSGSGGTTYVSSADGWNLVGNPYPSVIDWGSPSGSPGWQKTNISTSISIENYDWNPNAGMVFATYNSATGLSTNGGSRYIATGQSFWVKNVNSLSTPVLKISEAAKAAGTLTSYPFLRESRPNLIRLTLTSADNLRDETVINFSEKATDDLDDFDALKRFNKDGYLNLSSLSPAQDNYAINSMPFPEGQKRIPLDIRDVNSGTYSITFTEFSALSASLRLQLEDKYENTITDIRENSVYSFKVTKDNSATFGSGRFSLILGGEEIRPAKRINVYPVPVTGVLTIEAEGEEAASGEVLNMVGLSIGTVIFTNDGKNQVGKYDFGKENSGLYLIRIKRNDQVSVVRIVKD